MATPGACKNAFWIAGSLMSIFAMLLFVSPWSPYWIVERAESKTLFKNASLSNLCFNFGELNNLNGPEFRFARRVNFNLTVSPNGTVWVHKPHDWETNCIRVNNNRTKVFGKLISEWFDFESNYQDFRAGIYIFSWSLVMMFALQFKCCGDSSLVVLLQLAHFALVISSTILIDIAVIGFYMRTVAPHQLWKPAIANADYTRSFALAYTSAWSNFIAAFLFLTHYGTLALKSMSIDLIARRESKYTM